MTNEEAIKILKEEILGLSEDNPFYEAVELAIKALAVEDEENIVITECRKAAIAKGLPLYFIYDEITGTFEVYVTKTKELFEKRHCIKHLSDYEFEHLAYQYLDDYSNLLREWT